MWPAFWMLGNDIATNGWPSRGIDIMENIGREPGMVHGSPARPSSTAPTSDETSTFKLPSNANFADDFHIYGRRMGAGRSQVLRRFEQLRDV